ncbi:MAG: MBL fold metallo-hydrolase [Deltaproteobacteria bacterium]|uniref:MBL fold metallo-hydrolase n=1 Tax=Candidatus Deferrimicrobium sp. TaxID=3060586 RepID=UPI0027281F79|nr:MBL fold metallo-hydrolase [Candidatus Deferrimicrobium sp.]MCR4310874.1 MBL fold metallo-hydrolase [Deltaproteobacteria bacterium]MDO8737553.1 MBL fold metallo-hydrolase [Candidatus Deferrimicrobium sp.]
MEERTFGPVRFIPGNNRSRYPHCNSLYIEGAGILIDPGSNRERLARLKQDPGVKSVWLSHYHDDHILYLDLFDDVPLCLSEPDALPLTDLELYLDWTGAEDIEEFREHWRKYYIEELHFKPRFPKNILRGGDQIRLPGVTVEILHTPGHTAGHLAFFFEEVGVLFLGDYDLSAFGPMCGEPNASVTEAIRSIRRLRTIPAKIWITSHGVGVFTENPDKLWDNYLGAIAQRENKILYALTQPMTFEEIVDIGIIYGRPNRPRAYYVLGERCVIRKHLEHLIEESRVRQDGKEYVRV